MPDASGNPTPEDEARACGIDVEALKEANAAAKEAGVELRTLIEWYEAEHGEPWPVLNS